MPDETFTSTELYHTLLFKVELISKLLDISLSPLRSTMSILRRNTGGKVLPSDIDEVREAKSGGNLFFPRTTISMQSG